MKNFEKLILTGLYIIAIGTFFWLPAVFTFDSIMWIFGLVISLIGASVFGIGYAIMIYYPLDKIKESRIL